jgi:alpha-tubulin suppressor-like RCC1 family protein
MRIRNVLMPAIVVVMLCSASASQGATRARSLAEAAINDAPLRIAAGEHHTCQIKEDGRVRCWGFNSPVSSATAERRRRSPVAVSGVSGAVALARGRSSPARLAVDSTVRCWGDNGAGQLGDGTRTWRSRRSSSAV